MECLYKFAVTILSTLLRDTRQFNILPMGKLTCGVQGGMTSQALGGVNSPCSWYCVRGQPPSTGGQVHTLTHTICNARCRVTFTKIDCTIAYRGRTIICGHKCTRTGLWMVSITKNTGNQATSPVPPNAAPTSAVATNVDATNMPDTSTSACAPHQQQPYLGHSIPVKSLLPSLVSCHI